MIKLKNVEGLVELELSVLGYDYPEMNDDWYKVKATVFQGKRKFEKEFSALNASQLESLLDWFKCISQFKLPTSSRLSFSEPCIEFEYKSYQSYKFGSVSFSVVLDYEMRPPFKLNQFGRLSKTWEISFEVNLLDLRKIVSNIDNVLIQFPVRGRSQEWIETKNNLNEREQIYRQLAELSTAELEKIYGECELRAKYVIGEKMLKDGFPVESIMKYTGISQNEKN